MGHSSSVPIPSPNPPISLPSPWSSPSRVPVHHKQALTEDEAHKLLLLECLFKSIDVANVGWVARQEILDWVRLEPYLTQPSVCAEAQRMLDKLNHDEDSARCSYREFVLAFLSFTTVEVQTLIINLLRSASLDQPSNSQATATESDRANSYSDLSDDTNSRTLFLLDTIFNAIDTDRDDIIHKEELTHWLDTDPFFEQEHQTPLRLQIQQLLSVTDSSVTHSLSRLSFLSMLSSLARRHVKVLLIHLLHRTTQSIVKAAKLQRKKSIVAHHRELTPTLAEQHMQELTTAEGDNQDEVRLQREAEEGEREQQESALSVPCYPVDSPPSHQLLMRRHSVLACGTKTTATTSGLRLTLLGQSMIQHDLRETERGRSTLQQMAGSLYGDIIFSELETAISTLQMAEHGLIHPTRNTVFFHSAEPSVIDCLQLLNLNLFGLSSNHSGDLGEAGILAMMEEMNKRKLTYAGIGRNLNEAAAPAYLDTANGRIALISFASKVPIGSDATDERAGVNALWMEDIDSQKLVRADVAKLCQSINRAKVEGQAQLIIVYHHNHYWEKSNVNEESALATWKRKLAHKLIDSGAHMYIGHGDPRLQGIEVYKGCPIFFCLGNWIFQTKTEVGFYGEEVWESLIVQVHCHQQQEEQDTEKKQDKEEESYICNTYNDGADHSSIPSSYSVKLIPIVLNECGDGYHPQHEHAVKGNVITEQQKDYDVLHATRSSSDSLSPQPPLSSSTSASAAAIAATSAALAAVPVFLQPPPLSLNNSPILNSQSTASPNLIPNLAPSPSPLALPLPSPLSVIPSPLSVSTSTTTTTTTASYDLHLCTRGLPSLAGRQRARAILHRIQRMSEEWETKIEIDDPFDNEEASNQHSEIESEGTSNDSIGVVGWLTTKRSQDLSLYPLISRIPLTRQHSNGYVDRHVALTEVIGTGSDK